MPKKKKKTKTSNKKSTKQSRVKRKKLAKVARKNIKKAIKAKPKRVKKAAVKVAKNKPNKIETEKQLPQTTNLGMSQKMNSAKENPGNFRVSEEQIIKTRSLVEAIARGLMGHVPGHVDRDDMISEGYIGLLEAAKRFDPTRNIKFETYARNRIYGAMKDFLRGLDILPRSAREKLKSFERASADITKAKGIQATPKQIARRLKIPVNDYHKSVAQLSCHFIPMGEEKMEVHGGKTFYFTNVADDSIVDPTDAIFTRSIMTKVRKKIDQISEKDALILSLITFEKLTLKEIGYLLDFSPSTIRQMREKALEAFTAAVSEKVG